MLLVLLLCSCLQYNTGISRIRISGIIFYDIRYNLLVGVSTLGSLQSDLRNLGPCSCFGILILRYSFFRDGWGSIWHENYWFLPHSVNVSNLVELEQVLTTKFINCSFVLFPETMGTCPQKNIVMINVYILEPLNSFHMQFTSFLKTCQCLGNRYHLLILGYANLFLWLL